MELRDLLIKMFNPGIDNDDPNFDKFKLLLALPLSERDAQGTRHVESSLSW